MYNQKCFSIMAVNRHIQIRIFIRHDYIVDVVTLITFVSSHNRERKCGDFFSMKLQPNRIYNKFARAKLKKKEILLVPLKKSF